MLAYYGDRISPNMTTTPEGYLICHNVPIARTGTMQYLGRELGQADDSRLYTVLRTEEEVFSPEALASFEGKPVTDGHPSEDVTAGNFALYARGHVENVRRDGDYVVADLHIADPSLISQIREGVKREVSCGYACLYVQGKQGLTQQQIRGNHVAVVQEGRAGKAVSIKDSMATNRKQNERSKSMKKSKVHGIFQLFAHAARDASPEELEVMTADAAAMLEEQGETQIPIKAKDEEPGAATGMEAKLDQILSHLQKLTMQDAKQAPEDIVDAGPTEKAETQEQAETSSAEDSKDECNPATKAADALPFLKELRPAVAAIKDEEDRKRVTDALLAAIRQEGVSMEEMLQATQDAARTHAQAASPFNLEEQQAKYNARNPHMKKEEL